MPKLEPMVASSRAGGRRARGSRVSTSLAEINVVPLVDVMLVLLVIFMVAAPMMQQGQPVRLPESKKSHAVNAPVTVTVPASFRTDQRVQIDGKFWDLKNVDEGVKQALESHSDKSVILAGDGTITIAELMAIDDQLSAGGVTTLSIQTQPPTGQ